jgi:hypothetical protein
VAISIGELRGILTLTDNFSGPVDKAAKGLGIFGESFGAVTKFAGLAVGAIGSTTAAIVALGVHGADVADVQAAFETLTARAGETADVMLGALAKGTLGTISNFELMKIANTALGSGMIKSAEDMSTLAQGAQLLADRTGGSAADALVTLSEAMAKGTSKQADLKFMFRDSTTAVDNYAASIHKTPAQLTPMQEATAKSQGALKALRDELDRVGPATADFGDNIAQGKVAVQNLVDGLAVAIATSPVVRAGMQAMGEALQAAFGGTQQSTVKALMVFVNDFAIGLTYVGQVAVTAATVFVTVWSGIKVALLSVMQAVGQVGAGIMDMVAGLAELGQKIPGHAKWLDTLATTTRGWSTATDEVTRGLKAQADEAMEGVKGNSELNKTIDKIGGTLINVRERMEAANRAQGDLTSGADTLARGLAVTDEAVRLTAAQIKAMEEATLKGMTAMVESGDALALAFKTVQEDITLANTTGLAQRTLEIEMAQQKEIAGLQWIAFEYPARYDEIVAAVKEKYGIMSADAVQSFKVQTEAAISWRDTAIDAADKVLANALANLRRLAATKGTTEQQMADAHARVAAAEDNLDQAKAEFKMKQFETIASSASTILRSLFGKNKAAAIAAALIDTAAAVVSSFKNGGGWPWGLIPAAAMAAAGYAQIQKIRSTEFAQGTPGLDYANFGRQSPATLHGEEAVIPRGKGHRLAAEIADAMPGGGGAITIHLVTNLDGRKVAENTVRHMPGVLALAGVR